MLNSQIHNIYVLGDSVLKGVIYDEVNEKYTIMENNCAAVLSKSLNVDIINRAKMGYTAVKGLDLLKKDLNRGMKCDIAVLAFGGNDCDYDWSTISENPEMEYHPKDPINDFYEALVNMVLIFRENHITPILINLPPIDSERYFSFISKGLNSQNILKWLGEKDAIYHHHLKYSKVIEQIANELNCLLVDIRSAFTSQKVYADYLCMDGIHPNEKGQKLIQEVLLEYALK